MLSPDKDIRGLIRIAQEQGWEIRKLANNHLRWVPPKGPFVHSSSNVNTAFALTKIKHDLIKAGLVIGPIYMEKEENTVAEAVAEAEEVVGVHSPPPLVEETPQEQVPPPEEVMPMPRKQLGRGQLQAAVLEALRRKYPMEMGLDDVYDRVKVAGLSTTRESIMQSLYKLATDGKIEKVTKGIYKGLDPGSRAVAAASTPKGRRGKGTDMEQLTQAIEDITTALATIEAIKARLASKLDVLDKLKGLMG